MIPPESAPLKACFMCDTAPTLVRGERRQCAYHQGVRDGKRAALAILDDPATVEAVCKATCMDGRGCDKAINAIAAIRARIGGTAT